MTKHFSETTDTNKESAIYDDVFRTLENDCKRWMLPMLNEVFDVHYTGQEKIIPKPNEHFLNRQDGREQKRITDTTFAVLGEKEVTYHIECQANPDGSMILRMFEYDSQIALDNADFNKFSMTVTFPRSAVLYLRHTGNTPDKMRVNIRTDGGNISYDIPIIKLQLYHLEEIFAKKLLLFLPFYIFQYEKDFYRADETLTDRMQADFYKIREYLEALMASGELTEYENGIILDMTKKVVNRITRHHPKVRDRMEDSMVGKILDCPTKQAFRAGISQGISQGINQGLSQSLLSLICRKLVKGKTPEAIAEELEEAPEVINPLIEVSMKYAPDYDIDKIMAELYPANAET